MFPMTPSAARRSLLTLLIWIVPLAAHAQDTTKVRADSSVRAGMMDDHMMGPWKEMNAFHRVMGATWHPASQKNDMAPLKAQAKALLTAADAWAESKPPATPASCGSDDVRKAVGTVSREATALVAMVDSGADDARLKAALKNVHDAFEVAQQSCGGHGDYDRTS
jgi:hypothetical protein